MFGCNYLHVCNVDNIFKAVNVSEWQQSNMSTTDSLFSHSSGGVHRGNPLAKEWMASGHYSRLDEELKPILAKGENQQEQYSSKYATNFFNEVSIYNTPKMYFIST